MLHIDGPGIYATMYFTGGRVMISGEFGNPLLQHYPSDTAICPDVVLVADNAPEGVFHVTAEN